MSSTVVVILVGSPATASDAETDHALSDSKVMLVNEYGKDDNIKTIRDHLLKIVGKVEVVDVTISNTERIIKTLSRRFIEQKEDLIALNLCDGLEDADGYPGLSVVKHLEEQGIPFTGARSDFYLGTTSKINLKGRLLESNVPTSQFVVVEEGNEEASVLKGASKIGWPMILKPSESYASIAISYSSIVRDLPAALAQISRARLQTTSPLFLERFLPGREFTVLVTGDSMDSCRVYKAAERVFDEKLPVEKRLLAFEGYWDGYDLNTKKDVNGDMFVQYRLAPEEFQSVLQDVAKRAYLACNGTGYGRVDLRTSTPDSIDDVMVLEVNAQCGLGFEKDSSSLAEILILSQIKPHTFLTDLLETARARAKRP